MSFRVDTLTRASVVEICQQEWRLDGLADWSCSQQALVQSFHWFGSHVY